jgi:hypothetical protein
MPQRISNFVGLTSLYLSIKYDKTWPNQGRSASSTGTHDILLSLGRARREREANPTWLVTTTTPLRLDIDGGYLRPPGPYPSAPGY